MAAATEKETAATEKGSAATEARRKVPIDTGHPLIGNHLIGNHLIGHHLIGHHLIGNLVAWGLGLVIMRSPTRQGIRCVAPQ